ncbi:Mu transposase C-terminal domain-containing protein [Fredinandcohnia sp. QZ13]|uniref:Mu transposase C-terminal domain-containing protein n=1 Tax=Fredinandcohnia sp. QZ13 TaxID=3073144 RepID=UPI002853086F|nr:Mu transposase C-terminal domain-containing protein [Fredinandcohnia sp. QZ13]MDR4888386.1 Mu transposase C-terminal domain-containing protein [Fredinandcohnia sp. QZ13]
MNEISVNSIIEWSDEENKHLFLERVLWISPNLEYVVVTKIGEKKQQMPIWRTYSEIIEALETPFVRKLSKEPFIKLLFPEQEYLQKHSIERDEAWEILEPVLQLEPQIYDRNYRGELVNELIRKHGIKKKWIYKKMKQYWAFGKVKNALLPMYVNSGGPGKEKKLGDKKVGRPPKKTQEDITLIGVNVTEADKKIFKIAIRLYYEKAEVPDLKFTHDQMLKNFYHQGYHIVNSVKSHILPKEEEAPTYRQFVYWFNKEYSVKDKLMMKFGEKDYLLNYRAKTGNATKRAAGPGAIFEIDATVADVYLVSSLARNRIIGRPVVYCVKDVFSRMVVGLYVGLEGPSWIGAMMALENCSLNKKEYCQSLGINNIGSSDWPAHYLPSSITADRGELESGNIENYIDGLGIFVKNTPPYRADLKGIIEQHFRTINTKIKKWIPGAVHKNYKERGSKDYRLDAKLTLKSFEKIMVLSIIEHNKKLLKDYPLSPDMIKDNITPTPLNLWEWGIKNRYGHLKEISKDLVRLHLMPSGNASIREAGVYFNRRYYSSEYAIKNEWFEAALIKGSKTITVSYDPRNINNIYFLKPDGEFERFDMTDSLHDGEEVTPRVEDLLEYYEDKFVKEELLKGEQRQMSADTDAQVEAIIEEESTKTNNAQIPGQSKHSKTKDIRKNRGIEKETLRKKQAWNDTLKPNNPTKSAEIIDIKMHVPYENKDEKGIINLLKNLGSGEENK